jgi:tetratricopeptide (TPR) repeat protein
MPREYPVDFPIAAPTAARESLVRGAWRDASGSLQASPDLRALAVEVEAAVLAKTRNAAVLTNGALLRLDEGNVRAALLLARNALELAPGDPYAHVAMGATLLAGGNEYEAGREFQQARDLDPLLVVEAAIRKEATDSAVVAKRRVALTVTREADPASGTSSSSDGGHSKQTSTGSPSTPGASGSGTR